MKVDHIYMQTEVQALIGFRYEGTRILYDNVLLWLFKYIYHCFDRISMVPAQENHIGLIPIWFSVGNAISSGSTVISNNDSLRSQIEDASFPFLVMMKKTCKVLTKTRAIHHCVYKKTVKKRNVNALVGAQTFLETEFCKALLPFPL